MSTYAIHVAGDCNPYTCTVCAVLEDEPEQPILCAHHEQLVAAVRAERPDADLTGLADDFASDCDDCEVP